MLRRRPASFAMIVLLMLTGACADQPPPPTEETADELAEFQQEIQSDIDKVDTFLQKTQRGINLSEFNLGWFAMILLNELCSHDQGLYDYIHTGEMNVELYLRNSFQADPNKEIAIIGGMAKQTGSPIRLATRHVLEMLTHIPNRGDTPEIQAQTRQDLATTLTLLKAALQRVADAAATATPAPGR